MADSTEKEQGKDDAKSSGSDSSKQTITGVQPEKPSDIPKNAR
jgi:hypothetical protein